MKPSRMLRRGLAFGVALAAGMWFVETLRIPAQTRGLLFDSAESVPRNRVALVLGCVPLMPDGRKNLYLVRRLEAAARLFHAGRVDYLLVSGDAQKDGQDEPRAMREGLLERGVPADRIVVDALGLRTLDSVARAKLVFGLSEFTVVSQRFHNERAVYLARALGLSVVAYNADDPAVIGSDKMRLREPLARLVAVFEVKVLGARPRHLGERVSIGDPTG